MMNVNTTTLILNAKPQPIMNVAFVPQILTASYMETINIVNLELEIVSNAIKTHTVLQTQMGLIVS